VDAGASDVPDNTVLAHAFAKISKSDVDQGYAIKRSSDFVNEYPRKDEEGKCVDGGFENADHLMGCFPELMPYGKGGAALDRPVAVSYEAHADWAMQYEDGRFAKHLQYMFQVFGVIQKRQVASSASFRRRVTGFIEANIKADVHGADSRHLVDKKRDTGMSYSRPVDPRQQHYMRIKEETERKLVRAVQVHQCSVEACLVMKNNRLQCKRRAPFELSPRDWIDEDGSWGPKRTSAYINNWNPAILHCVRSNHDIKLISNGTETKDLAFYITNYVAKKQRESSNVSALLAKRIAFHKRQEKYTVDATVLNKRLLQRCANTLSREQEFSAPEVSSYLRGHGDRYLSDFPVTIYLDSIRAVLKHAYPSLRQKK
jgi:hypothetical protein